MFFLQEPTPDTSGYMIAGYAIAFLVMALYVASIYLRKRNLQQDMSTLEELDKPTPPVQASPAGPLKSSASRYDNHRSAKPVTKKSRRT